MSLDGSEHFGLLENLHAKRCGGQEYSTCRPVVVPDEGPRGATLEVVYMAWCGECGAADYEVV